MINIKSCLDRVLLIADNWFGRKEDNLKMSFNIVIIFEYQGKSIIEKKLIISELTHLRSFNITSYTVAFPFTIFACFFTSLK